MADMRVTNVTAQEAYRLVKDNPELIVLDLRTPDEFEMFFIKGARNINATSEFFARRLKSLKRDHQYLIHCHSGSRSAKALETFENLGFQNIIHMHGGLREWNEQKLPIISNWSI